MDGHSNCFFFVVVLFVPIKLPSSVGGHCKTFSEAKRTKFILRGAVGKFCQIHTRGFKMARLCIHTGLKVKTGVQPSCDLREGRVSSETKSVRFAGLLWPSAMAPNRQVDWFVDRCSKFLVMELYTHHPLTSVAQMWMNASRYTILVRRNPPALTHLMMALPVCAMVDGPLIATLPSGVAKVRGSGCFA